MALTCLGWENIQKVTLPLYMFSLNEDHFVLKPHIIPHFIFGLIKMLWIQYVLK